MSVKVGVVHKYSKVVVFEALCLQCWSRAVDKKCSEQTKKIIFYKK